MAEMREQILELVKTYPKQYTKLIKKDRDLLVWVEANSLCDSESFVTRLYSAVHQQSNKCHNGNSRIVHRFSQGFTNCGPASSCQCTRNAISTTTKQTKQSLDQEAKNLSNEKRKQTMIAKYGVSTNSQRPEIKEILQKPKVDYGVFEKLDNTEWLAQEYQVNYRTATDIALELGVDYSTVLHYLRKKNFDIRQTANYSIHELEIKAYIESLGFDVVMNTREVIAPYEIDIYIPSKKLAIELNGLYWHSFYPAETKTENKLRHLQKTELVESLGVSLLHITDQEWRDKKEIVKNLIRTRLGLNQRIYARQCRVIEVSVHETKEFLNSYHFQGYAAASYNYALIHDDRIVSMMTFGKSRFQKEKGIELIRSCSLTGFTVVGGMSKIIAEFFRRHQSIDSIFTYCDRSKSSGTGYLSSGFVHIGYTGTGYFWTDGDRVITRYQSQKKNLKKILGDRYSESESEAVNMFAAGYRRYWDCGNIKFECRRP